MSNLWDPKWAAPALWLDTSDTATLTITGGGLDVLGDKSANEWSAAAPSAGARPSMTAVTLNGHAVARFNGSSHVLRGSLPLLGGMPFTQFMVYRYPVCKWFGRLSVMRPTGGETLTVATWNGSSMATPTETGNGLLAATEHGGPFIQRVKDVPANHWGVGSFSWNSKSGIDVRAGGIVPPDLGSHGSSTSYHPVPDGSYCFGARWSEAWGQLDFAEHLLFHRTMTLNEVHAVEGYLAHKWGLAESLHSDHPWRNLAPRAFMGNAIKSLGGPAQEVVIRDWVTKAHVGIAVPQKSGVWAFALPEGAYDITYLADGCKPLCHGPYHISYSD